MSSIFNDSRHFAFDEDLRPNFRGGDFQSFSDVIAEAEQKDIIKVGRSEGAAFQARPVLLQYADGRIFDDSGREFICFHYTVAKSYLLWMLPSWRTLPEKFYVNKFGFFRKRSRPLTLFCMVVNPRYCKELVKNIIRKRERIFSHFRKSNPKMIFTLIKDQF